MLTLNCDSEFKLDSIIMTRVECVGLNKCHREYILKAEYADKLQQITNAAEGSTAFCIDTCELYILHNSEWLKVGADSE